jgi:hypothetical protein
MSGSHLDSPHYELLSACSRRNAYHIFWHSNRGRAILSGLQLFLAVGEHARYALLAHPWIFNIGEMLTGLAALAGAVGLYQVFRTKTHLLLSILIGFLVACIAIMAIKAGMFPMPDSRHNSWGVLQNFVLITPFFFADGSLETRSQLGFAALSSTLRYAFVSSCSVGFPAGTWNSTAPNHRAALAWSAFRFGESCG